jgi:nucleoside-diphosphate-sugar epimerase
MTDGMLLTGPLEPTNEWYAIAKIAGIKLFEAYRRLYGVEFISLMPTNLYGPGDNYHPERSQVPAVSSPIFAAHRFRSGSCEPTGHPRRASDHVVRPVRRICAAVEKRTARSSLAFQFSISAARFRTFTGFAQSRCARRMSAWTSGTFRNVGKRFESLAQHIRRKKDV